MHMKSSNGNSQIIFVSRDNSDAHSAYETWKIWWTYVSENVPINQNMFPTLIVQQVIVNHYILGYVSEYVWINYNEYSSM